MNRPLVLRVLPARLSLAVWARIYRGKHASWAGLYEAAPLRYAPHVTMSLVPGDTISDVIAFTGVYEIALTRRIVELARRGGTMIDIGGNLGYFSLLWAGCNPRNRCVIFEASPRNVEFLRRNVHRNGFDDRIEIHAVAANSTAGTMRFNLSFEEQTGWGGFATVENNRTIDVESVRVDEVIVSDDPIAVLKVDVEGADAWALIGCERLLRRKVIGEIWYERNVERMRALGIALDTAEDFLRSVGYVPKPEGGGSEEWSALPSTLAAAEV